MYFGLRGEFAEAVNAGQCLGLTSCDSRAPTLQEIRAIAIKNTTCRSDASESEAPPAPAERRIGWPRRRLPEAQLGVEASMPTTWPTIETPTGPGLAALSCEVDGPASTTAVNDALRRTAATPSRRGREHSDGLLSFCGDVVSALPGHQPRGRHARDELDSDGLDGRARGERQGRGRHSRSA